MSGPPKKTVCQQCNAARPCWTSGPCMWFREQIVAQGPKGAIEMAEWAIGTIAVFTVVLDTLTEAFPALDKQPMIVEARQQLAGGPVLKIEEPAA